MKKNWNLINHAEEFELFPIGNGKSLHDFKNNDYIYKVAVMLGGHNTGGREIKRIISILNMRLWEHELRKWQEYEKTSFKHIKRL